MTGVREAVAGLSAEPSEMLFAKLSPGPGRPAMEVADHQCARVRRALIELSAEHGYEAVTLRELVRRAGVSTRAFYRHYSGKEECLLHAHELIWRRLLTRLIASQARVDDWQQRARRLFHALVKDLGHDPDVARLLFIEIYAAGPTAVEQARRANRSIETRISESFAKAPDGIVVPPLIAEGMVAGVSSFVRAWLSGQAEQGLADLGDQLTNWALCYASEASAELARIDSLATSREPEARPHPASDASDGEYEARVPSGDLALLLSAAAKLAGSDGRESLTVRRILVAAGAPRRSFYAHFESAEDCLAAALELQIDAALISARSSKRLSAAWARGAHQAIVGFCAEIAGRPALTDICAEWPIGRDASGIRRCRERLVLEIARLLTDGAPPASCADHLVVEASANAVLGVLWRQETLTGSGRRALCHAGTLAYLALAPTIGADQAIQVIAEEYGVAVRG